MPLLVHERHLEVSMVREYLHRGHTVTDIKYHFVWATKYRYPVLKGEVGVRIRDLVKEICTAREITVISGVVSKDHVHLLVSSPPELSPSRIMRFVKGATSRKVQMEYPHLRRRYWGQHFWARGYFCASSGTVTDEMIKAYLEHHKPGPDEDAFKVEVPE